MKVIEVAKPVEIPLSVLDPLAPGAKDKTSKATFFEFCRVSLDSYEKLGKGPAQIRQAIKIHGAIDTAEEEMATTLVLEDADYDVLKDAVEAMAWKPGYARRVIAFYDAVLNPQPVEKPGKAEKAATPAGAAE